MTRRVARLIVGTCATAWLATAAARGELRAAKNRPSDAPIAAAATAAAARARTTPIHGDSSIRPVTWADVAPAVRERLETRGLSAASFPDFLTRLRAQTDRRLRDGNFDHIVYYALQSRRLTRLPPIEPALSARTFVEELQRTRPPTDARARLDAMAAALADRRDANGDEARLALFRDALDAAGVPTAGLGDRLQQEYARCMGFLYEKEFIAPRTADSRQAVATLYQSRSHSSDTQIEAGYPVSVALATLKALDPARRLARILIVGPGLDVAPRTGLLEDSPPHSYQPFAVADAVLALGLADTPMPATATARVGPRIDLADINPLVVRYFAGLSTVSTPLPLTITSGLPDDAQTRLSEDYRAYVAQWGRAIADGATSSAPAPAAGHLQRRLLIDPAIPHAFTAARVNIIADRFTDARRYDLIVITNVLPYLDDVELLVALSHVGSLLAPGGYLIHNEPRALLLEAAAAIGLPAVQARTVLLASPVSGGPLHDTVLLHRRQ